MTATRRGQRQPAVADVLNTRLLIDRRRELKLATQDLSRAVGLPLDSIRRIEEGDGDALLTVAQLARLADVLGLPIHSLLQSNDDSSEIEHRDDAATVMCLLLGHGTLSRDALARTLGWRLPRTQRALDDLSDRAAQFGMTLVRNGFKVTLHRITDVNSIPAIIGEQQQTSARASISARAARYTRDLLHVDPDCRTAPGAVISDCERAGLLDAQAPLQLDRDVEEGLRALLETLASPTSQPS